MKNLVLAVLVTVGCGGNKVEPYPWYIYDCSCVDNRGASATTRVCDLRAEDGGDAAESATYACLGLKRLIQPVCDCDMTDDECDLAEFSVLACDDYVAGSEGEGEAEAEAEGECVGCGDYVTTGVGELCAGTSTDLYDALASCACETWCADECADSACAGEAADEACASCVTAPDGCGPEFDACAAD